MENLYDLMNAMSISQKEEEVFTASDLIVDESYSELLRDNYRVT
jgi:hypothetical protein